MSTTDARANRRLASALLATMGLLVVAVAGPLWAADDGDRSSSPKTTTSSGTYVVILEGLPAAAYRGGVDGYRRTAAADRQYDSTGRAAVAYTRYLTRQQDAISASVGASPYYHYTTALNGFAAELTSAGPAERRS